MAKAKAKAGAHAGSETGAVSDWVGRRAPDFRLKDQEGVERGLSDYRGRYVVLFMYPKDDTPGCTKEACGFRDLSGDFEAVGAAVLGMSVLGTDSKAKFARKHGLGYPLLADEDARAISAFGAWREKSMYGKTYMGVSRETFVIDPEGVVAGHWPAAKGSEDHAGEVLAWLRERAGKASGGA